MIKTNNGWLEGRESEQGIYYRCFPYGQCERFEDPRPISWSEVYRCDEHEPVNCPQRHTYYPPIEGDFYYREFNYKRDCIYDEHLLTMSVITPPHPQHCPVLIYIHGGSFDNGLVDDVPIGNCYEYAKRGIILVSVGYRLNVFGLFGAHNYGLKDQVFAINWCYENIAAFGGDPEHMVLMGQSAGAMSINDLLMDKDLEGKVHGAVMMSGYGALPSIIGPLRPEDTLIRSFWDKVMLDAGCSNLEELKKVDAEVLWNSWSKNKLESHVNNVKQPGIDGEVIKKSPKEIFKNNEDLNIPILFGVTSQDMFPEFLFEIGFASALRCASLGRNVWGYFFDYTLPGDSYHAFHGSDMWYLFGNMDQGWRPFGRFDQMLSKKMIDYVANFIIQYNPNGEGLEPWPAITSDSKLLRLFSDRRKALITANRCRSKMLYTALKDRGPM